MSAVQAQLQDTFKQQNQALALLVEGCAIANSGLQDFNLDVTMNIEDHGVGLLVEKTGSNKQVVIDGNLEICYHQDQNPEQNLSRIKDNIAVLTRWVQELNDHIK